MFLIASENWDPYIVLLNVDGGSKPLSLLYIAGFSLGVVWMDEWNETEWNGMKWNEMEWNGMKWNETEWNEIAC